MPIINVLWEELIDGYLDKTNNTCMDHKETRLILMALKDIHESLEEIEDRLPEKQREWNGLPEDLL